MKVTILKEESNFLQFEFEGDTHTLSNALRKELWSLDGVEHASYHLSHPQVGKPVFFLKVGKGKPRKVFLEAVAELKKKNKEMRSLLKKLA